MDNMNLPCALLLKLIFIALQIIHHGLAHGAIDAVDIPFSEKPFNPYFLEYHMTRYHGGCWIFFKNQPDYNYSTLHPFIFNFDYLISNCGIDWLHPHDEWVDSRSSCTYKPNRTNPISGIFKDDGYIRVHVKSLVAPVKFFIDKVLPDLTDKMVIVHLGASDRVVSPLELKTLLDSRQITRLVLENNKDAYFAHHSKTVQLPNGICARENQGRYGDELRAAEDTVNQTEFSRSRRRLSGAVTQERPEHREGDSEEYHRILRVMARRAGNKTWESRSNRVLLCFQGYDPNRPSRVEFIDWGQNNCTICDVCDYKTRIPHAELWEKYTQYRYIVSPHGNGLDCGRTWEILLLGAIPVIHFFQGANGYSLGGLKTVVVDSPSQVNETSRAEWNRMFKSGNDPKKLSREYWNARAFSPPTSK